MEMYFSLAFSLHQELENNTIPLELFKNALKEVGKTTADTMKRELNFTNTIEDAVDAWIIGSKAMNVTLSLEKKDDLVIFHHIHCPMWNYFREKGSILCEDVCFPVVEAMAKEICPDVKMVILRHPDKDNTCVKGLKRRD